jgi:hypothetical protein
LHRTSKDTPIWIEEKGNIIHFALCELLLERNTERLEPLTSLLDIIDGESNMTETSTRFSVAVCITPEVWIGLRAVIVGEFKDTW